MFMDWKIQYSGNKNVVAVIEEPSMDMDRDFTKK